MKNKPNSNFDATLQVRCPATMLPDLHATARARGMTAASFVRSVLLKAMAESQKAAA